MAGPCGKVAAPLCLLLASAFFAAHAQELDAPRAGLSLSSTLERVVASGDADGAVRLESAVEADGAPAEQFVYSVRFTNLARHAADGVRITSSVPPGLRYEAGSAVGPGSAVLFSIDGGATYGTASELRVVEGEASRRAVPADYTHVRWILQAPVESGATGFVRFRASAR